MSWTCRERRSLQTHGDNKAHSHLVRTDLNGGATGASCQKVNTAQFRRAGDCRGGRIDVTWAESNWTGWMLRRARAQSVFLEILRWEQQGRETSPGALHGVRSPVHHRPSRPSSRDADRTWVRQLLPDEQREEPQNSLAAANQSGVHSAQGPQLGNEPGY